MTAVTCCRENELLLHGLADGELDAANAFALENHLQNCAGCAAAYGEILRQKELLQRDGLRLRAPAPLRERVLAAIAAAEKDRTALPSKTTRPPALTVRPSRWHFGFGQAGAVASAMAFAASLVLFVSSWNQPAAIGQELVAAHVRSLLVNHLTDVASS